MTYNDDEGEPKSHANDREHSQASDDEGGHESRANDEHSHADNDSVKNIMNIHMYSILKNILKQTMIMNIHM